MTRGLKRIQASKCRGKPSVVREISARSACGSRKLENHR